MNYAMELHDSRLEAWQCDEAGRGFALFYACIHRADGPIFVENALNHESGWQRLRFGFYGMRIEGEVDFAEEPYVHEGELWVNGTNSKNIIFLPAEHTGEICLKMCVSPLFNTVKIHATIMESELVGEFEPEHVWQEDRPFRAVPQQP